MLGAGPGVLGDRRTVRHDRAGHDGTGAGGGRAEVQLVRILLARAARVDVCGLHFARAAAQGAGVARARIADRDDRLRKSGGVSAIHVRLGAADERAATHAGDDRDVRGVGGDSLRGVRQDAPGRIANRASAGFSTGSGRCCGSIRCRCCAAACSARCVGALPGAGADIAAWISYGLSKRFSKTPEKFGTGHVEGVIESGAANNSCAGGRVDSGAGVRHSRRLDHGDRDRRALPEGHEPGADDLHRESAEHLRGVHRVLPGESAAASVRVDGDQDGEERAARAARAC